MSSIHGLPTESHRQGWSNGARPAEPVAVSLGTVSTATLNLNGYAVGGGGVSIIRLIC